MLRGVPAVEKGLNFPVQGKVRCQTWRRAHYGKLLVYLLYNTDKSIQCARILQSFYLARLFLRPITAETSEYWVFDSTSA